MDVVLEEGDRVRVTIDIQVLRNGKLSRPKKVSCPPESESMAARMLEEADEPIRLSDLLRGYGLSPEARASRAHINPDTTTVRRCALIKRDLIRFVFGQGTEYLTNEKRRASFDDAIKLFLREWDAPAETSRKKMGSYSIGGRWYVRKSATKQEKVLGYQVLSVDCNDSDLIG